MELTPLLFCFLAVVLRHSTCKALCSPETVKLVKSLLENLPKMELYDSKLYTPTISNYGRLQDVVFSLQQNCSKSTVECFAKEMTVLVNEISNLTDTKISQIPQRIGHITQTLKDKIKSCPECEVYKEENADIFLETLHRILQMMCSKN